jgi:Tol biopolymer transport system component
LKGEHKGQRVRRLSVRRGVVVSLLFLAFTACSVSKNVTIEVDGKSQVVETEAETVRQVLSEAQVTLGDLDRVEPDLWEGVQEGMEIRVTRVEEESEVEVQKIPFERRVIKDEALEVGESRVMQTGAEGEEEVVYLVTYEDGEEVARKVEARRVVLEPVPEVKLVGAKGLLASIPISGTIVYISYGNAWVMRHESGQKRPLTVSGDLDGRVFALSPDGTRLLFTRTSRSALNSLWVVSTVVVGDEPQPLGLEGVRYAEWSSDGDKIAYSTAEKSQGAPGWKARNDLYILDEGREREVVPPSTGGIYGWWGTNFAWSPDGSLFAYADADEVGVIDASTGDRSILLSFAPYYTYAEWVWVPTPSWSPDSLFLVTTAHHISDEAFDLWVLGVDGKVKARLVPQVGIWSWPRWSFGDSILFGQAENPDRSQESRYLLYTVDRDGSNEERILPWGEEGLVVEELDPWVWSPGGREVVVVKEGNLHFLDLEKGSWKQLTIDGGASQPRWAR